MLNAILKWSIAQRWLIVIGAIIVTVWGVLTVLRMPLDVFPNFAPPQVDVQTEAPGLAPEEVESLVTFPIESAVNGTPGVDIVRSSSGVGISVVQITFNWGTDVYLARQLVSERLQQVTSKLPTGVEIPQISPLSSPIGTVLTYAFTIADGGKTTLMDVRNLVDLEITNQLLAVPGVTQVLSYGGETRQYQVLVDPAQLRAYDVTLAEVTQAVQEANTNAGGGFLITPDREYLIRGLGRIQSVEALRESVVVARDGVPVLLGNVADIQIGAALKRGDASANGKAAIVMMVNKQPLSDTPTVTRAVEAQMETIKAGLPEDVEVTATFRQSDFIDASIENVTSALRDGIIIVAVVLLLFLMNWRTAVMALSAIPLSLLIGLSILNLFGLGINTMTLGGLAVAIGSVVDDAIVDMENSYRRLRENQLAGTPVPPLQVVYNASREVRVSVLFSTIIIAVIFAPIFTLTGIEGKIFAPMGFAYLLSIFSSTFVALTLSPALSALLLSNQTLPAVETWVARTAKRLYQPLLRFSLSRAKVVLMIAVALFVASMLVLPTLGRVFLPEFQERSLVNTMTLYPGSSLELTSRAGLAIQDLLIDDPRFDSVQLRAGRVSGDADAASVSFGHVDVEISEAGMKDREATIETLRETFAQIPGVVPGIGGFISHRIDEILSGVRSAIAIKIFGPDLDGLRSLGAQIQTAISEVPGLVDLQLEPQVDIKQLQIEFDRQAAARYGLTVGQLSETVETAFNGRAVSQVLEGQQLFDLLVWLQEDDRSNLNTIRNLLVDTPNGTKIPLAQVADISFGTGPNTINRENVLRRFIVSTNVTDRDLGSAVEEIKTTVAQEVELPEGYFIQYGGQFESEQRASQNLITFGLLALVVVAVMMYFAVKSVPATVMIMLNLPLALSGGIFSVALGGGILSVASMVGFITLFGVATRNGLLLVDNYNNKFAEGKSIQVGVIEGSTERLEAILMTALTSALGMLPLVIGSGAGKEILQPLAVVVLGGLFTSTALTLLLLPALYAQFGRFLRPKSDPTASQPEPEADLLKHDLTLKH
ncbi:efflux RND transporter permease subunit [Acaryochloris sp. CCMEE 5410]|uniref:efflux RND transporter permease subunit n=1 Tax=Acaryochloris sp. CCMEE 5410 TaxID=310037 RepID=UPI0002485035|nr:efflux RND transporter permease subunit [Acaryochloris sp. CCMEE 5410]KAI9130101.1 CusA/CzcA family heavy metal efflux RND transporter [Acaryochloris sp. CCMEE 5410]